MNRTRSHLKALYAVAACLLLAVGCARNKPGTVLAPTGFTPDPAVWPGGLTGRVTFDLSSAPDLANPPYPTAVVVITRDSTFSLVDTLPSNSQTFTVRGLKPGLYSIVGRSPLPAFKPISFPATFVADFVADVGTVKLPIDPAVFSSAVEVVGTMPGFTVDDMMPFAFGLDPMEMSTLRLGVWTYPNADYSAMSIPAGTYHFKFLNNDPAITGHLDGWGGNPAEVLQVPVTNHPSVYGRDHVNDIVAHFPATGVYAFTFDERRQTFTIALAPSAAATRLARR